MSPSKAGEAVENAVVPVLDQVSPITINGVALPDADTTCAEGFPVVFCQFHVGDVTEEIGELGLNTRRTLRVPNPPAIPVMIDPGSEEVRSLKLVLVLMFEAALSKREVQSVGVVLPGVPAEVRVSARIARSFSAARTGIVIDPPESIDVELAINVRVETLLLFP
jgi:hypothetical protein